jgi:15-cis-phytoene synthase
MQLYSDVAYKISERLTLAYSTSFGLSSRLFSKNIRMHIYAIYGLVRIADEIVDTYTGKGQKELLDTLEKETYVAIKSGYSVNPIVHAFALTAQNYNIDKELIAPFFDSMRIDAGYPKYNSEMYEDYIYGSAEVIGLMCLKVFVGGDTSQYKLLEGGARALGSAYQKVNFLRDFKDDYYALGRVYFPGVSFDSFSDAQKAMIIKDIDKDFKQAERAIIMLPRDARLAVKMSFIYYSELLDILRTSKASYIAKHRVRVSNSKKMILFAKAYILRGL